MDPIRDLKKLKPRNIGKPKKKFEFSLRINLWKVLIVTFLIIFFLPFLVSIYQLQKVNTNVDTSKALVDIRDGKIKEVLVQEEKLILTYNDDSTKIAIKEEKESFSDLLDKAGINPTSVKYRVVDQSLTRAVGEILGVILPIVVMAAFFFFIIRAQTRGAQDIFSFGRSRARLFAKGKQSLTFEDVAGVEEAKKELEEVVDFLKNPAKYRRIGARTPKGALLFGPSGVGKTLLARAVAGETGGAFFSMAGGGFLGM